MQKTKRPSLTEEQESKMITVTDKRLQDNIYITLRHHPFYATLQSDFTFKTEISEIPVAAVSIERGRPVRHTNPLGYLTYQQREEIFIDIHEIFHITDLHHPRAKGRDLGLWNICTDIEINQQIISAIALLPKDALMYYHFNLPKGLSAEEYYDILDKRDEPIKLPPELQNSLLNDLINGDNNSGSDDAQKPQKSKKAPGFENLHPHWEKMTGSSIEVQKAVIKDMVSKAMRNHPGNIPGEMQTIIERLFEIQLNWPELLSTFSQSLISTKKRYTWSRPSRKFGNIKMGTLRSKELNLWVVLDVSYSTKPHLEKFITEIGGMEDYANITVIQVDTHIKSIEQFSEIDLDNFKIRGLGGTSFLHPFELATKKEIGYAEKKFSVDESPDGIVYLTDGEGRAPDYSDIPTLWVLTPGGQIPNAESGGPINWGEFAHLDQ
ncbi:VWA-like domain-containing protein [[Brevibacterium] frigoritolerans]|nr:VWA-like domain-containing protein [Peribacillus frigoritolerans]